MLRRAGLQGRDCTADAVRAIAETEGSSSAARLSGRLPRGLLGMLSFLAPTMIFLVRPMRTAEREAPAGLLERGRARGPQAEAKP
jgi:hypothetical protein